MFGVVSLTMGNSPLPLADRRLSDEEPVGEFPLGKPQLLPAAADIRAEGLLVFMLNHPFGRVWSCKAALTIRRMAEICKAPAGFSPSTVRKVLIFQGVPALPARRAGCPCRGANLPRAGAPAGAPPAPRRAGAGPAWPRTPGS